MLKIVNTKDPFGSFFVDRYKILRKSKMKKILVLLSEKEVTKMIKKFLLKLSIINLLLLVLLTYLCYLKASTPLSLKKLVINIGNNINLDMDGYQLINSNVNFNQKGKYFVTYKQNSSSKEFIREVEIVDENASYQEIIDIDEEEIKDVEIKDVIALKDKYIYLVCDANFYYVLIKGFDIVKSEYIQQTEDVDINHIYYDEELQVIYGIGNIYNSKTGYDGYLFLMDIKGIILGEDSYIGNRNDIITNLDFDSDYLYIVGYTTSSDGNFKHQGLEEDSFLFIVDKYTLKVIKYYNFGEIGCDKVLDVIITENIYLIIEKPNDIEYIVLDFENDIYTRNKLTNSKMNKYVSSAIKDDEVYLVMHVYNYKISASKNVLYKIDSNQELEIVDEYFFDNYLATSLFISGEAINIIYSYNNNFFIRTIGTNYEIKSEIYLNELDGFIKNTGSYIILYSFNYLKIKKYNYSVLIKDNYLYNGNNAVFDENKSLTKINKNIFGTYILTYYYDFETYDVVVQKKEKVDLDTNIWENNCYDVGVKIYFNGIGKLNNELIDENTHILTPGTYVLEVIGNNDEAVTINFKVVDVKIKEIKDGEYNQNYIIKDFVKQEISEVKVKQNLMINDYENNLLNKNLWYLLIPSLTIVVSVVSYFVLGRKIK